MQPLLALLALVVSVESWAQCGVNQSCPECKPDACLISEKARQEYEKKNNCKFAPGDICGGVAIDAGKQCCGKDSRTGNAKIIDKVMTTKDVIAKGADSFTWMNYVRSCPDKKQNNAAPNALWQQCEVGKLETPADFYKIVEVQQNGTNRPYCIDGCSEPPSAVAAAYAAGIFLTTDHNNPTGYSEESSFYKACAKHDVCYQTCNDNDQTACDVELKDNSINACSTIPSDHVTIVMAPNGFLVTINTRKKCKEAADDMFAVLNIYKMGRPAFNMRRQQYCQCC
jgi:hypothetical protein